MLIQNNKANATIVIPENSDTLIQRTAEDIQDVFSRMSGVELAIKKDSQQIDGNRILLGDTEWTDGIVSTAEKASLPDEAFILRRQGGDIALVGGDSYGVAYAASEMFERLGARCFIPGPLGEVIPELDTIQFEELDVRQKPSFPMRWVSKITEWNLRVKGNRVEEQSLPRPDFTIYPGIYHTQDNWLPHSEYFESHPEYFALIDGERSDNPDCKLCNSNTEMIKEIAHNMKEYLDNNPNPDYISLSPTDHQLWCECEDCLALDEDNVASDQTYSRRQLVLYNRVARELEKYYPDQKILTGAYNVYTYPPADPDLKAHRNLAVVLCHYDPYCMAHPINDPDCRKNKRFDEIIRAWAEHTSDICFYEYYRKTNWLNLPWPIVHSIKDDIPYIKKLGLLGLHTQGVTRTKWTTVPNHYIAAKLLWDHTADVESLMEDFYKKFYGQAAEPMKAYHELLENQMANCGRHIGGYAQTRADPVFTPHVLSKMDEHLQEARQLAENEKVQARIDKLILLQGYSRRLMHFLNTRDKGERAEGVKRYGLLLQALREGRSLQKDVNAGKYGSKDLVWAKLFQDDKQIVRALRKLEKQVENCKPEWVN